VIELDGLMVAAPPAPAGTAIDDDAPAEFAAALAAARVEDGAGGDSGNDAAIESDEEVSPESESAEDGSPFALASLVLVTPAATPADSQPVPIGPVTEVIDGTTDGEPPADGSSVLNATDAADAADAPDATADPPGDPVPILGEPRAGGSADAVVGATAVDGNGATPISDPGASGELERTSDLPVSDTAAITAPLDSLGSNPAVPTLGGVTAPPPAMSASVDSPAATTDPGQRTDGIPAGDTSSPIAVDTSAEPSVDVGPDRTDEGPVDESLSAEIGDLVDLADPAERTDVSDVSDVSAVSDGSDGSDASDVPAIGTVEVGEATLAPAESVATSGEVPGQLAASSVSGLRSNPTPSRLETAPPVPPTPDAPSEATPVQQIAEALNDVRRLADGSHRLSLQLHPQDLGAVQLEIAVRDGRLHVRAVAETEAARAAIEQSLPELRNELREVGVRPGSLEVGPDSSGRDASDAQARSAREPRATGARGPENPAPSDPTIPTPSSASGVDIRL
jgi:flagellar hook-length control protein FliK